MLIDNCNKIAFLFSELMSTNSRLEKEDIVSTFKTKYKDNISLLSDLNFCFEVLAGKYKLGYTLEDVDMYFRSNKDKAYSSIYNFYQNCLRTCHFDWSSIIFACQTIPPEIRGFIIALFNREYRLGYSNKNSMINKLSPMLAKKYQDIHREKYYYIQEKLDGNRCIAYYDDGWKFQSRSGKPLKVNFDMKWADTTDIFDGEIMTDNKVASKDFTETSGIINSKYLDKSNLIYCIYDIVDDRLTYEERLNRLTDYELRSKMHEYPSMTNTRILPVLEKVYVWSNHDYNPVVDKWLDKITDNGGEGIMLRDPEATYQCGKRSEALLKYKKLQTMDLRIIGYNEGNGKYEGMIGSFICEDDEHTILVNVAGMDDDIRSADPDKFIGKIIEVAYFDISESKTSNKLSLRFPRLKKFRDDKDTTSKY